MPTENESRSASEQSPSEKYPKSPMPAQHQERPSIEAEMSPRPEFLARDYKGADKLKDKVALITGEEIRVSARPLLSFLHAKVRIPQLLFFRRNGSTLKRPDGKSKKKADAVS